MKISELEARIDLYSLIAEKHTIRKVGKNNVINPCPVCGSKDHFFIYPTTNSYSSFSECCKGGSVYKYLQEVEGKNEEQAYAELHRLAGEIMTDKQDNYSFTIEKAPSPPAEVKGQLKDKQTKKWITELYHNQSTDDKRYFLNRGIHPAIIDQYQLSVFQDKDGKRAMLPIFSNGEIVSYTTRALDGQEPKYKNAKGSAPLFNIDYVREEQDSPIFVTEGIFDALTLETRGYKAIALGGLEHASKLIQAIQENKTAHNMIFLTAFDNDEAGQEKARDLSFFKRLEIPEEYKDLNEWGFAELKANQDKDETFTKLTDNIEKQLQTAAQPDAVNDYLEQTFQSDIDRMMPYKNKRTGFDNLDAEMKGLYPGLYVVGGISSVGKTTFVHQLGDQLAEQGDHVIFFSLEQSKMEMVSKSLARTTAKLDLNNGVSSVWIRSGHQSSAVIDAIDSYKKTGKRVNIVEGNFNTDVHTIRKYVENYIQFNKTSPIVIVDYLQIMPALNDRLSDKQRIDTNVTELKRMSRDLNLSVFVISSLNRGNYLAPIDFESFKESGGIEYTADVVWGLQLEVINDELFDKKDKVKEKREKIKDAKVEDPRQIELVCLKNRNGKPSFSCSFSYWAKYDFYEPNTSAGGSFSLDLKELKEVVKM